MLQLGNDHLTLGVELVVTGQDVAAIGELLAADERVAQECGLVLEDLVAIVHEVEVALEVDQLVAGLLHVVDVQVVTDNTVLQLGNDHLTVGSELIVAGQDGAAVGELLAADIGVAQEDADVSQELVALVHEVEVALVLNQTVSGHENALIVEVVTNRAVAQGCDTVGIAIVVHGSVCNEGVHNATGLHDTGSVEHVGLAIDHERLGGSPVVGGVMVVVGTVPVTHTGGGLLPDTGHQTAVLEVEGDTVQSGVLAVGACIGARIEVVPTVIQLDPAVSQLAVEGVVGGAVDNDQTAAGVLVAASANQLGAGDNVAVAGCGNVSTPVNDGIADCAVGAAGIAVLGAGGSQIGNSGRSMDVSGATLCLKGRIHDTGGNVHLGVHAELLVGEHAQDSRLIAVNIGNLTHIDIDLQVVRPEIVGIPIGLGSVAINEDIRIVVDHADGQSCQSSRAGLGVLTGTGNGDGSGVVLRVNGVLSGEAIGQNHVIQLPMVGVVEIDHGLDRLDGLDVGSIQVHPVERTAVQTIEGGISGDKLNGRSVNAGLDIDETDNNRLIAHVIGDLELHTVHTVCDRDIADGHTAVVVGNLDLDTVNICLCGSNVQAGSVGLSGILLDGSHDGQQIAGHGHGAVLLQFNLKIVHRHGNFTENGGLSIIYRVGEVSGDVVDIDREGTVDGTVGLPQIIGFGVGEQELNEAVVIGFLILALVGVIGCGEHRIGIIDTGNQNAGISTDIHGVVSPTRLIKGVVNLRLVEHGNGILLVVGTVIIGIIPVKNTDPAVLILIGNIYPETDGKSILNDNAILQIDGNLCIVTCRNVHSGQTVGFQTQRSGSVMDLAVLSGSRADGSMEARLMVTVNNAGLPCIKVSHIFKVEEDLGALTQIQSSRCDQVAVNKSSGQGALQIGGCVLLRNRSELQTVEGTESIVGGGKDNVGILQDNIVQTAVNGGIQTDDNLLVKRNGHNCLSETEGLGDDDLHRSLTDDLAVVDHLSGSGTNLTVGHEQTVLNGTHGGISHLPGHICGNVSGSTDQVSTEGTELHGAAGGVVHVGSGNGSADELTGCGRGGDDQNTVGGGTLCTVGGTAVDLQLLTGTLGQESGGSAAVTVHGVHAAQRQHELCHLVAVEACGVGSLTTVVHDHNEGTVGLDTHKGTGCGIAGVVLGVLVLTVLDQEAKVSGNDLLLPAGDGILGGANQHLGHIGGTGDAVLLVEVDDETGLGACGLTLAVLVQLAVQNEVAERLTNQLGMSLVVIAVVPAQSDVHSGDNVAVAVCLGIRSLLRHDLNTVVAGSGNHSLRAGNDLGVGVVEINLHNVGHLSVSAGRVVQHDLRLDNTGSELPVLLGDELVVVISALVIIVIGCSKSIHRDHADQHEGYQQHRKKFDDRGLHRMFSFSDFFI